MIPLSMEIQMFHSYLLHLRLVCSGSALDGSGGVDGRSQQAPSEVTMLSKRAYVKSPLNMDTQPAHPSLETG